MAERVLKNTNVKTDDGGDEVGLKSLEGYPTNLAAAVTNKKQFWRN